MDMTLQRLSYDESRAYILQEKPTLFDYLSKGWLHDDLFVEICTALSLCSFTPKNVYQCMNRQLLKMYANWYVANLCQDVQTRKYFLHIFEIKEEAKLFGN